MQKIKENHYQDARHTIRKVKKRKPELVNLGACSEESAILQTEKVM